MKKAVLSLVAAALFAVGFVSIGSHSSMVAVDTYPDPLGVVKVAYDTWPDPTGVVKVAFDIVPDPHIIQNPTV